MVHSKDRGYWGYQSSGNRSGVRPATITAAVTYVEDVQAKQRPVGGTPGSGRFDVENHVGQADEGRNTDRASVLADLAGDVRVRHATPIQESDLVSTRSSPTRRTHRPARHSAITMVSFMGYSAPRLAAPLSGPTNAPAAPPAPHNRSTRRGKERSREHGSIPRHRVRTNARSWRLCPQATLVEEVAYEGGAGR